jgi:hypothetical protein
MDNHKSPMYACFAFFANGEVKRWKYVRDLKSFSEFLSKAHSSWKYFNVYDKGTKQYLKRFYPGNPIPKTLLLLIVLLTQKFTFGKTFTKQLSSYENTFNKTTFSTFTNGFNYYATIPTPKPAKKEVLCS